MRSIQNKDYELDVYFNSSRFLKRLNYFRKLGEGYEVPGAIFIVHQFRLMPYHYGIIYHYIKTGEYDPKKENNPTELIDYTNKKIVFSSTGSNYFKSSGYEKPDYGLHLVVPPGITKAKLLEIISSKDFNLKDSLKDAYPSGKRRRSDKYLFRPEKNIDLYLEIADKVHVNNLTDKDFFELSADHGVDEADIRRIVNRFGYQNNPYLNPVQ